MIAEYKLYHGAVLADLVHRLTVPVMIDELHEEGRLTSYIIDSKIGLQIKHSTQRLRPWQFTFTERNIDELRELRAIFPHVFLVFVCYTVGMVCCDFETFETLVGSSLQPWIRVDKPRGQWFQVGGPAATSPIKFPNGIDDILKSVSPARYLNEATA